MNREQLVREANERFDEMLAMREAGMTINEIALQYGISKQRISQLFIQHDKRMRILPSDEEVLMGDPIEIAEKYSLQHNTIIARLKRLGISFPRKPYTRSIWPRERVMELYADYQAGMTQIEIAAKYGVHQTTVSHVFLSYGLVTTPRGWLKGRSRKVQS